MPTAEPDENPRKTARDPYVDVLGVRVSAVNMTTAISAADDAIRSRLRGYVCVTGVHGVMEAQTDPLFREILNRALINTPDGMPMSWMGWMNGHHSMDRVYGPDFMLNLCELSVRRGYRQFLLGGKPGVASALRATLEARFPGLNVVGVYTPPFRALTPEEEDNLCDAVHAAKPDIIWVGLSTPKQEKFMATYYSRFDVPLMVGVGAAFDIHTGQAQDAPKWIKRAGLQWLHRLIQEPRRLGPRYLKNNPKFIWMASRQLVRRKLEKLSRSGREAVGSS